MKLKRILPIEERVKSALTIPYSYHIADVRATMDEAANWYVRAVTCSTLNSWLVRYAFFPKFPGDKAIKRLATEGVIMHPDTAVQLFPEYAVLDYEAEVTKNGINLKKEYEKAQPDES